MKSYRFTDPISVMLKEENSYVLSSLPRGAIVSLKETPPDFNRHVIVDWNGKNTLLFARELLVSAERIPERKCMGDPAPFDGGPIIDCPTRPDDAGCSLPPRDL